jgi:HEAT repeat protein
VKKRRIILLALALIVVFVITILVWPGEREPEYQGKKLSEWLAQYSQRTTDFDSGSNGTERDEAAAAVRHIGTNALPFLLEWMSHEPAKLRAKIYSKIDDLGGNTDLGTKIVNSLKSNREKKAELAWCGFEILGPLAAPAIPQLQQYIGQTNSAWLASSAVNVLGKVRDPALPMLLSLTTNQTRDIRLYAVLGLFEFSDSTNAPIIVESLVHRFDDGDVRVAQIAIWALGQFKEQTETVVPVLSRALQSGNSQLYYPACQALASLGVRATNAIPAILPMLHDTNIAVRQVATNALLKIAPEMLPTNSVPSDPKP